MFLKGDSTMTQNNLLWLDLEMTGLHVEVDEILEIAAVITNHTALSILSKPFHAVIYQNDQTLEKMGEWVKNQHTKTGLVDTVKQSTVSISQADGAVAQMLSAYGKKEELILCGNSIWQDRTFVKKYMPLTYAFLHYRMIDVSAIKQVVRAWYPNHPQMHYVKKDNHRAVDDVYESINELLHYKKYFFI